ncbi:MAG TPA: hypothetical protein DCR43_09550 [Bacteroidales bacterium]|nr:MAG: hypothetical protein A2X11_11465 [Bacteroidetes bacterium GWE2_42_24]OFY25527.1 MAG: hypothetical protein A2X09_07065 [Bacteroidetes bacterium GWF2_43_11]HAQ66078.1 hypothetical protein [Bacteroidales bacterium]HBZ66372.1 hypothetical protein [Bacteroidales bacterium]
MNTTIQTPDDYINQVPAEHQEAMKLLRETIGHNLPEGFSECISYGMIGWVIPHSVYSPGYHCDPKLPLPFISIASRKNFIALYHMGLYAMPELREWLMTGYQKHSSGKPDMSKSCLRFKKPEKIPFQLIGELAARMTPHEWIAVYERELKK